MILVNKFLKKYFFHFRKNYGVYRPRNANFLVDAEKTYWQACNDILQIARGVKKAGKCVEIYNYATAMSINTAGCIRDLFHIDCKESDCYCLTEEFDDSSYFYNLPKHLQKLSIFESKFEIPFDEEGYFYDLPDLQKLSIADVEENKKAELEILFDELPYGNYKWKQICKENRKISSFPKPEIPFEESKFADEERKMTEQNMYFDFNSDFY